MEKIEEGFIIQESSTTGARQQSDFTLNTIALNDFEFERNPRLIADCSHSTTSLLEQNFLTIWR